jgi:hypothetical protein
MTTFKQHLLAMDKEQLISMIGEYENAINWFTTCFNCATLMDKNHEQYIKLGQIRKLLWDTKKEGGDTVQVWKIEKLIGEI